MKYRKKPIVIEAVQWFKIGDHDEVIPYNSIVVAEGTCELCGKSYAEHGLVSTLEDSHDVAHRVCPEDWIIKGVQGEFYPCKPDIFEATYELAE